MYEFIQLNLTKTELIQLNACRMYLQVSLLSDITTPNAKTIIMQFLREKKPKYPCVAFKWPNQDFPNKPAWTRWFKRIQQIFTVGNNGKLPVSKQLRE